MLGGFTFVHTASTKVMLFLALDGSAPAGAAIATTLTAAVALLRTASRAVSWSPPELRVDVRNPNRRYRGFLLGPLVVTVMALRAPRSRAQWQESGEIVDTEPSRGSGQAECRV